MKYDAGMEIVEGLEGLQQVAPGGVISVGNFDGVHRGHQRILQTARDLRQQHGGELVAVTFEPHPLTVLAPHKAPPRLTPAGLKRELLAGLGVDRLVVLPPSSEVLELSAEAFWAILRDRARPSQLVEGGTFTFGKGRGGNVTKLAEWTAAAGVGLHVVPAVEVALMDLTVAPVSSSLIRWLIGQGRVRDAAVALGRAYALEGRVIKGYQRGRGIGFPTANIGCDGQLTPLEGVYAGRCAVDGVVYPAAVSVGRMETFGDQLRRQVEAYLIGFDGDLYDRELRVEMIDWIRGQMKFAGVEALVAQIGRDVERVRQSVGLDPSRPIARLQGAT